MTSSCDPTCRPGRVLRCVACLPRLRPAAARALPRRIPRCRAPLTLRSGTTSWENLCRGARRWSKACGNTGGVIRQWRASTSRSAPIRRRRSSRRFCSARPTCVRGKRRALRHAGPHRGAMGETHLRTRSGWRSSCACGGLGVPVTVARDPRDTTVLETHADSGVVETAPRPRERPAHRLRRRVTRLPRASC
jgi:hypothetical protein